MVGRREWRGGRGGQSLFCDEEIDQNCEEQASFLGIWQGTAGLYACVGHLGLSVRWYGMKAKASQNPRRKSLSFSLCPPQNTIHHRHTCRRRLRRRSTSLGPSPSSPCPSPTLSTASNRLLHPSSILHSCLATPRCLCRPTPEQAMDASEVYDRQIRLWGLEAQKRMQEARVLFCGLRALPAEVGHGRVEELGGEGRREEREEASHVRFYFVCVHVYQFLSCLRRLGLLFDS